MKTTKNEDVANALYGLAWYYLPYKNQADICNAINHLQHGPAFTIGPFEILNFEAMTLVWTFKTVELNM